MKNGNGRIEPAARYIMRSRRCGGKREINVVQADPYSATWASSLAPGARDCRRYHRC